MAVTPYIWTTPNNIIFPPLPQVSSNHRASAESGEEKISSLRRDRESSNSSNNSHNNSHSSNGNSRSNINSNSSITNVNNNSSGKSRTSNSSSSNTNSGCLKSIIFPLLNEVSSWVWFVGFKFRNKFLFSCRCSEVIPARATPSWATCGSPSRRPNWPAPAWTICSWRRSSTSWCRASPRPGSIRL